MMRARLALPVLALVLALLGGAVIGRTEEVLGSAAVALGAAAVALRRRTVAA